MNTFQETIRGHVATVTLVSANDDGTATWEVEYVGQRHLFTLDEWRGFGGYFCGWALNRLAARHHKQRHQLGEEIPA